MRQAIAASAVLTLAALSGCDGDLEVPRSDVEIMRINGGYALQSAVRNAGEDGVFGNEDDFITEDQVWVTFVNNPSDEQGTIGSSGAFSSVTFDRYRVSFTSTPALADFVGTCHARVASGDSAGVGVVVVPAVRKQIDPLVGIYTGTQPPIEANATIEFWGEEKTSGQEIHVSGSLVVNFGLAR